MAEEEQNVRERMREELFGADSEGEEDELQQQEQPQQEAEGEDDVDIYVAPAEQAVDEAGEADAPEQEEAGISRPEEGQDVDAGLGQQEQDGEYYEEQEEYGGEEAVEEQDEDEISRLLKGRGRKKAFEKSFAQISAEVESFLAGMEVAAEADAECNRMDEPALAKLRMLPQLEAKIAEQRIHDMLMDAGILGCLKAWIEPMPNGHLPNSKVRSAVLKALLQLMVDVTQPNRKEQLKRSGVGRAVLFLNKLPEETPANRRLAKQLVEAWSRPIFDQYSEARHDELRAEDERAQLRAARQQKKRKQLEQTAADAAAEAEGAATRQLKPGQPGFRWHAAVPQPARLDYLEQPESKVAITSRDASARKASKPDRLGRKLKMLNRKVQAGANRAKISL